MNNIDIKKCNMHYKNYSDEEFYQIFKYARIIFGADGDIEDILNESNSSDSSDSPDDLYEFTGSKHNLYYLIISCNCVNGDYTELFLCDD